MNVHIEIIKLIIAYTLAGAFVFTVIITCISLIYPIFKEPAQQRKLFYTLIIELVVICLGFFSNVLAFDPQHAEKQIIKAERYKLLITELDNYVFSTEIMNEFLQNNWTTLPTLQLINPQYNLSTTNIRKNENSNLLMLKHSSNQEKEKQYEEIMELVNKIDQLLHSLNDEFEKVQNDNKNHNKVDEERAKKTADELKPLLISLKEKKESFLKNLI